jgi:quercetin dioxygenase-like cupin family protein
MPRKFFMGSLALLAAFGAGAVLSPKFVAAQATLFNVKEVLREEMVGMPGEEVLVQYIEYKPGAAVPWHTHPDAHEITVVVEGTAVLEVEGQGKKQLGVGEGFHMQPNVVHRGGNESGASARVVTVRIKPKDKPIMVPVQR